MSRSEVTIAGLVFEVEDRFAEGQTITLTEGQASSFNQLLRENVRNNFAGEVKAARTVNNEDGTTTEVLLSDEQRAKLQSDLDAYVAGYDFGVRRAGTPKAPKDPVLAEALNIAKQAVRAALTARNLSVKADQVNELAAQALEKNRDKFVEEAKRRIAEASELASLDLSVLGAGTEPAPKKGKKAA